LVYSEISRIFAEDKLSPGHPDAIFYGERQHYLQLTKTT
jgi:hypothetical protein